MNSVRRQVGVKGGFQGGVKGRHFNPYPPLDAIAFYPHLYLSCRSSTRPRSAFISVKKPWKKCPASG